MFPNVFKLYKSVWKSMILPTRVEYSEDNMGHIVGNINGRFYRKENYTVENIKGQKISVTLYLPEDNPV